MKLIKITNKKIYLECSSKKEMNLAFFRISEFYEGDRKLRGKYFSPDQFIETWTDKRGEWKKLGKDGSYFAFWDGYNISVKSLRKFEALFGGDLSAKERTIIWRAHYLPEDGYVMAGVKGDKITLKHELAHGLYFENIEYRMTANHIVSSLGLSTIKKFRTCLRKMKYVKSVFTDEIHAYLVAYSQEEFDDVFSSIKYSEVRKQRKLLGELYKRYNKN